MQAKWIGLTAHKKNHAIALLLAMLTPIAHAAISCSDMDASGPHYQERMEQIAKQANLPGGTYLRPHEQVVANYCHGNTDANRELVQQRYVRQQDVSSIERLLQVENHANAKVESAHPTNESASIEELVNKMFVAWSQQWFVDRYVDHSSHVTEMKSKDGSYFVRGEFRFVRSGGIAQIPFSAAVKKQDGTFTPINLCYNDTTSGMTDCIDSSTNVARVQLMRAIILAGVVAAFSDGGTSHESSTSNGTDESWRYRHAEEKRVAEEKADQEKREAEHERYQQETEEWERARKEDGDRVQQSLHEGPDY